MIRLTYSVLTYLLLPIALLRLLRRSNKQPEYRRHWAERFGYFGRPAGHAVIWIHAVSVGETRAAQPLVAALQARFPDQRILFTHMTPTGRETSNQLFGASVDRVYLPYDTPGAVARFLTCYKPTLGVIMETELWPNLLAACHDHGVPVALVNARLSQRSANRYARWPRLTRQTLNHLTAIAAQGADDADRLRALGAASVDTTGNIKFDIDPPADQLARGQALRTALAGRPLFLCASTRDGEEALILDAWPRDSRSLLVIVPRHPQRFDEVAGLIAARGLTMCRRSTGELPGGDTQVWLGDSMGELFAWYAAADVAFVGGSLLDFGSQNLIEPCSVGTPVLLGPSTYNFADAAREAIQSGAAQGVTNANELVRAAQALIDDPQTRATNAEFCLAFARRHRGATARTMALIERMLSTAR